MLDARETGEEVPALLGITSDRDSVVEAVEQAVASFAEVLKIRCLTGA